MNCILQRVDDNELIHRIDVANSSVALYAPGVRDARGTDPMGGVKMVE